MKSRIENRFFSKERIRRTAGIFLLIPLALSLSGQVVTTQPAFPVDADSCTVIFDASQGDKGLMNASPPVYAHTGVITNLSTSPTDWKYVLAAWNTNIPKARMTSLGNNLYKLSVKPSIRSFYGVPSSEKILKMAFVFRNSDGSKSGRNADGSDIFADVYPSYTYVNIVLPAEKDLILKLHDTIVISAISPLADTLQLRINGSLIKTVPGQQITDTILADNSGKNWVKRWISIRAKNDSASVADSFSYTIIPDPTVASLPTGTVDGINYPDSTTAILSLYAPYKNYCFVTGDFNDWSIDSLHYMNKTPDGNRFWLQLNNLIPRKEYIFQYIVDGNLRIGDPYADKVSDPNDQYISAQTYPGLLPYPSGKASGIATVLQTAQPPYPWSPSVFTPPDQSGLVIYELLIRDFTSKHTFISLIDTLGYLKNLGINAVELMPVMEFEGNSSWGYNTDFSFAADKYYGPKNTLKQFVETAHSMGIAVILDIVCNHHFGSSPLVRLYWDAANQRPAANSPWFNPVPKHPFNVGYDFNHQSDATRNYMIRLVKYWLHEYHVDGFRFDMSKGFTQVNSYPDNLTLWAHYDQGRVDVLNAYANSMWSVNPEAYVILEHFADNDEEITLSNANMMLWGNSNYNYNSASMGYNTNGQSDLSWASYKTRGWLKPNLVSYMESHDEERQMYKDVFAGNSKPPYSIRDTNIALKRVQLCANFFFTMPGPKMLWQFGELGYDYSINYPSGTSDSRLSPKPIRWDYYSQWRRRYTFNVFRSLIELRKSQPVFQTSTYSIDVYGAVKRIWLTHSSMNAVILGNFDVVNKDVVPVFPGTGTWYEYYTGDSIAVTDLAASLSLSPGEYRLYTSKRLPKPVFTGTHEIIPSETEPGIVVYPNPSMGMVHFSLTLPVRDFISLGIYDMNGKSQGMIWEGKLPEGIHHLNWDPGYRKGIFLYKMVSAGHTITGKFIVL